MSGATGNGKSITLKTFVERVATNASQEIHVLTIEDPTEYELTGDAIVATPLIYDVEELGADTRAWALAIRAARETCARSRGRPLLSLTKNL